MHFVKKVPTTEEQRARKEKERNAKLRAYCAARDRIFEKRLKGELDDEMLLLTGTMLEKNPDVYTFWNIRRTTIEKMMNRKKGEEDEDEEVESDEERINRCDSLLTAELFLTEQCLLANCKSYGAWFQRGWALKKMHAPNVARELAMCEKALKVDARNFHCWDYRREVARLANLPPEEELQFSDRLINENFSNYSAWHYRLSLLPRVSPDPDGRIPIAQGVVSSELKKLANAFFTDPEDQSAWMHAECLVDLSAEAKCDKDVATFVCASFEESKRSVLLVLTRAVSAEELADMVSFSSGDADFNFTPISIYSMATYARAFRLDCEEELSEIRIRLKAGSGAFVNVRPEEPFVDSKLLYAIYEVETKKVTPEREQILRFLVDNCKSLMEELATESNQRINKWPLLMYSRALAELDAIGNYDEIIANMERLRTELDPQRESLYSDVIAKHRLNALLREVDPEKGKRLIDSFLSFEKTNLRLADMSLTSVAHLEPLSCFITYLDLSGNRIQDIRTVSILPRLTHLTLDGNPISRLDDLFLVPSLEVLSVARTLIATVNDVSDVFSAESLKRFIFCETLLARNDVESRKLSERNKGAGDAKIRLIRYWM